MVVRTIARGSALALLGCIIASGLIGSRLALAHSGLQRAEPPVASTLRRAPEEVKLYFSERLEAKYSSVRVEDKGGKRVDRDDSRVDRSNAHLLRVSLSPLERGSYTVIWRVLSVDTHVTQGRFTFRVE